MRGDGNDLLAVHRVVRSAAERARHGDGPTLIEFETFRMRGHEEASGTDYVPKALLEEWAPTSGAVPPLAGVLASVTDENATGR